MVLFPAGKKKIRRGGGEERGTERQGSSCQKYKERRVNFMETKIFKKTGKDG